MSMFALSSAKTRVRISGLNLSLYLSEISPQRRPFLQKMFLMKRIALWGMSLRNSMTLGYQLLPSGMQNHPSLLMLYMLLVTSSLTFIIVNDIIYYLLINVNLRSQSFSKTYVQAPSVRAPLFGMKSLVRIRRPSSSLSVKFFPFKTMLAVELVY